MKQVLDFLNKCGVYYLATVEGDQPRVRPFGAACIFEGRLYITTGNKKPVYAQMLANPKVEISGMSEGKWIRLTGTVVTDPRRAAKTAMLEAHPQLRSMYDEDDGILEVLYLKNATAQICSFTEAPVIISF